MDGKSFENLFKSEQFFNCIQVSSIQTQNGKTQICWGERGHKIEIFCSHDNKLRFLPRSIDEVNDEGSYA